MHEIVILGSTGSIGVQALEIVAANPDRFRVVGLSAGSNNLPLLFDQAKRFKVPFVATTATADEAKKYSQRYDGEVIAGADASTELAAHPCDVVLNGITGSIGLAPTLSALSAGNRVALANKESLVAGGELVMKFGRDQIIPVDSEHSALYQCFLGGKADEVAKVILTASGGPFRDRTDLSSVTVAEALAHPTWAMGPVVTINSATLMNKGLEIIEAHYLFDIPYSRIDAVIHPQSVVHSMVEFIDGSTLAQASPPNMKGPISYAIADGHRVAGATQSIDWTTAHQWSFAPINEQQFPAVALARHCGEIGGGATTIYNAANEIAVAAFINQSIPFTAIVKIVESSVKALAQGALSIRDLSDVSAIEQDARLHAERFVAEMRS